MGEYAEGLDEAFQPRELWEDKSLFKARGPVWHQRGRKSEYHGRVYGYGGHWTTTQAAFPLSVEVETACGSEAEVIDRKAEALWAVGPHSLIGDNACCSLRRVRIWAKKGDLDYPRFEGLPRKSSGRPLQGLRLPARECRLVADPQDGN